MSNSFYSEKELQKIGFRSLGKNVCISKKASIYSPHKISIGSNVRIDDFCVLSGNITLGNHIHIAVYCALFAGDSGITLKDFTTLSSRCVIYAKTDDYSGNALISPTVPDEYTNIFSAPVTLHKHVVIGTGTSIMPGVTIGEGTAVGSMSLVKHSIDAWGIYAGIPCKKIKDRSQKLLELEENLKTSPNQFL